MTEDHLLSREQVRSVDRIAIEQLGLPGIALMENAGRGATDLLLNQDSVQKVLICAAGGNNGGDGFVMARHLTLAGKDISLWLFASSEKLSGDALINFQVAKGLGIPIHENAAVDLDESFSKELDQADWIVDALFGTGLQSNVREPYASLIRMINESPGPVLAVDIPSGLDCDTGLPLGVAVEAKITATFVAEKVGFPQPTASHYLGEVEVISIGVPWDLGTRFHT